MQKRARELAAQRRLDPTISEFFEQSWVRWTNHIFLLMVFHFKWVLPAKKRGMSCLLYHQKISLTNTVNWLTSDTSFTPDWAQDFFSSLRTPQEKGGGSVFIEFSPQQQPTALLGAWGTVFGKFRIEQDLRKVIKHWETPEQILVKGNFPGLEVTPPQLNFLTPSLGCLEA